MMDLYKELGQTFETLPEWRLGYERRVLNAGPKNLKGCKNASARRRWKSRQRDRVNKAKKELEKHNALLAEFNNYQKAREAEIKKDEGDNVLHISIATRLG